MESVVLLYQPLWPISATFRYRCPGLAQPFRVVIAWRRVRDCSGFGYAVSIFGMGDARSRLAMTAITVSIIAVVVSVFPMVANSLAGMIAAQSIAAAITVSAAGVI